MTRLMLIRAIFPLLFIALPRNREQVRSFIAQVYQANWRNVVIAGTPACRV